jgi:hypothetical protein
MSKSTFVWASSLVGLVTYASSGCIIEAGTGGTGAHGSGSLSSGSAAGACAVVETDDDCQVCVKSSCCAESEACPIGSPCDTVYTSYYACLYPDGVNWSGFSSAYCEDSVGAKGTAAGSFIECLDNRCSPQTACGSEPKITWDNFAAEFMENYCNGCHFPGFVAPNGHAVPAEIPQFTTDDGWPYWPGGGPKANPDWKTATSWSMTTGGTPNQSSLPEMIYCGVSITLPDQCANDFPGHFPTAERFPPAGTDPTKAQCTWTSDWSCPQPTDFERAQMASWIFAGTPK